MGVIDRVFHLMAHTQMLLLSMGGCIAVHTDSDADCMSYPPVLALGDPFAGKPLQMLRAILHLDPSSMDRL